MEVARTASSSFLMQPPGLWTRWAGRPVVRRSSRRETPRAGLSKRWGQVGSTLRTLALLVRDRTCRFRGCGRPARWCDGHHLRWVEHGGETTLPNLVLACRLHHRMLHQRKLTLVRADDGWWDPVPMCATAP